MVLQVRTSPLQYCCVLMSVCAAEQMDGRPGTKKGKAVKQLPAMKDMKDKLLTNQREAVG